MTGHGDFEGRVAIITGASRGIGRATARLFAERGAGLVLLGRDRAALETLLDKLATKSIAEPVVVEGDVGVSGAAEQAVQAALDTFGRLDIVANIAGVFPTMLLEATTDEAFASSVETNLGGTFRLCRAAVPALRRQAGGAIVNVSSTAARFPTPGLAVYGATKAAVEALTRALAAELAPHIRVNAVSPGPTLTESVRELMASDTTGAVVAVTKGLPLQRLGEPEEIAEALLFLASDRASFITGQVLHVNGGGLMA